jgi:hypothetical protein
MLTEPKHDSEQEEPERPLFFGDDCSQEQKLKQETVPGKPEQNALALGEGEQDEVTHPATDSRNQTSVEEYYAGQRSEDPSVDEDRIIGDKKKKGWKKQKRIPGREFRLD